MFFSKCFITFSICKVGDCGIQTYQTVKNFKRATPLEFTTITPILYIHCCAFVPFLGFRHFLLNAGRIYFSISSSEGDCVLKLPPVITVTIFCSGQI